MPLRHVQLFYDRECSRPVLEGANLNLGKAEIIDGVSTHKEVRLYAKHARPGPITVSIAVDHPEVNILSAEKLVNAGEVSEFIITIRPDAQREEPIITPVKVKEAYEV